jgi:hypothetical protein
MDILKDKRTWIGIVLALAVIAIGLVATRAHAADKGGAPAKKADDALPYLKAPTSWTGCYVGPTVKKDVGTADPIFGVDGYAMGVAGGCDMKLPGTSIVIGALADYDWQHFSQFGGQSAREWSFGGRVGFVPTQADNTLIYGVLTRPQLQIMNTTANGIGYGAGIETQLTRFLSAGLEWRHNDFSDLLPGMNAREDTFGARLMLRADVPASFGR